jgi:hypothetical protein
MVHPGARPRAAKRDSVSLTRGIGGDHRDVGSFQAAFRAVAGADVDFQLLAHALGECRTALAIRTEHGYRLKDKRKAGLLAAPAKLAKH